MAKGVTRFVSLEARVGSRWHEMLEDRPDLEPAIRLQRTLVGRLMAAVEALAARGPLPSPSVDRMVARLGTGLPALGGEPQFFPTELLAPLVTRLADDLAEGGAGEAARHVGDAIRARRLDASSLVAASLARDARGFRLAADQLSLAPDLLWLIGEMAASPLAHTLATAARALPDENLVAAFAAWQHGWCPLCGSWPAVAHGVEPHVLHCSFCATEWIGPRERCIYCEEQNDSLSIVVVDASRPDWLLELCTGCGGYVKVLGQPRSLDFPLHALEDLATSALDLAALERGFHRPPLRERTDTEASPARLC